MLCSQVQQKSAHFPNAEKVLNLDHARQEVFSVRDTVCELSQYVSKKAVISFLTHESITSAAAAANSGNLILMSHKVQRPRKEKENNCRLWQVYATGKEEGANVRRKKDSSQPSSRGLKHSPLTRTRGRGGTRRMRFK